MSRNRRNQSAAVRFAPAMKAALLCAFIGGSALGYVWQKNQIIELGRKMRERESRLGQLRQANLTLSKQLIMLRSPACLERRLKEMNLGLCQPSQAQILRLVEALPGEAGAGADPVVDGRVAGVRAPARKEF